LLPLRANAARRQALRGNPPLGRSKGRDNRVVLALSPHNRNTGRAVRNAASALVVDARVVVIRTATLDVVAREPHGIKSQSVERRRGIFTLHLIDVPSRRAVSELPVTLVVNQLIVVPALHPERRVALLLKLTQVTKLRPALRCRAHVVRTSVPLPVTLIPLLLISVAHLLVPRLPVAVDDIERAAVTVAGGGGGAVWRDGQIAEGGGRGQENEGERELHLLGEGG